MRASCLIVAVTCASGACASPQVGTAGGTANPPNRTLQPSPAPERLAADTPRTTAKETSFIAPKDWKIAVRGAATLLELPEAGSRMALGPPPVRGRPTCAPRMSASRRCAAYRATLRASSTSLGGLQHPTFAYELRGREDIVLTVDGGQVDAMRIGIYGLQPVPLESECNPKIV
jgi:hypothetical protein